MISLRISGWIFFFSFLGWISIRVRRWLWDSGVFEGSRVGIVFFILLSFRMVFI